MPPACIVTDNTAQFRQPSFVGRDFVHILPLDIELDGLLHWGGEEIKASQLPRSAWGSSCPRLHVPSVEQFQKLFNNLAQAYDEILGIFASSQICSCYARAQLAADSLRGRVKIVLLDSMTFSIGLGLMVESAAEALAKNFSITEAERIIRSTIPRIYSVICTPGLSYLYYNDFLDQGQALVGEMLGLYPIFTVEDGRLIPVEKMRSYRNALGFFQEFLDEFDRLQHIALLQGNLVDAQEIHFLRDHIHENFPKTPFTSHAINLPLAVLFGPQTTGIFVIEMPNHRNT